MISFLVFSCSLFKKKKLDFNKAIIGNWLILYPDHELVNAEQRKLYATAQDSIVALLGLKTVSFKINEAFLQTDSIFRPAGKWRLDKESSKLFIRNAGKGLDFFEGNLAGIENDTMRIVETILLRGQKIKLTWFLKRITDKKHLALFSEEKNEWRKIIAPETAIQLRKRIKAMLLYYSLYYEMVSKESAYFSQSRVFLPFRYYQHAIGLRPFSEKSNFNNFFHNKDLAKQAHWVLAGAMDKMRNESFPSDKDFVIEYSKFIAQLAAAIE